MTRPTTNVTVTHDSVHRLPDWAAEPVAQILDLKARNQLASVAEELKIQRQGGYAGIDVFVFLLFYFGGRVRKGMRLFWEDDARTYAAKLGAVADRRRLASSSALSRALSEVEFKHTRGFGPWLLRTVAGMEAVMRHPAAQTYDATGQPWHVFDFDPTVHALRHRALPDGEDLPEPRRRSAETAAPGYSGRKRGDVLLSRGTLQHSGSATWLDVQVSPGNGDHRAELARALDVSSAVMDELGAPRSRGLLRADGAFGHVPGITAARERGVAFLSRLTRPNLLDQPEVRNLLSSATWEYVCDSGSGPKRSATEVGLVTLQAASTVRRADGSPFEPVDVRVVVSRFPTRGRGRGRAIGGWHYELYIADGLSPRAWPAAEAVAAYYGRTAEENRFGQEDRELGLDRIFSYHLPGQELATLVALFVWNLRIARGFDLEPPPEAEPARVPRQSRVDERHLDPETGVNSRAQELPATSASTIEPTPPADTLPEALERFETLLRGVDRVKLLSGRPGWSWNPDNLSILCPAEQALHLSTVLVDNEADRGRVFWRTATGVCHACPLRASCFPTASAQSAKQVSLVVKTAEAADLRQAQLRLRALRGRKWRTPLPASVEASEPVSATPPPSSTSRLLVQLPTAELEPGPLTVVDPLLLPAKARRVFHQATRQLDILVAVDLPTAPARQPRLVAASRRDRQHRRHTWTEHRNRYALPPGTSVDITVHGGGRLKGLLASAQDPPRQIAAS